MNTFAVTGCDSHSSLTLAIFEAPPSFAVAADSRRQSVLMVWTPAVASIFRKEASETKDSGCETWPDTL